MSFVRRKLEVVISLVNSPDGKPITFEGTDNNSAKLSGELRMMAKVVKQGGATKGSLNMTIFGLTLSKMNKLSTLGQRLELVPKNLITVKAGDAKIGMFTVFEGTITAAYADLNAAPQVGFRITGYTGAAQAVTNAKATSYRGAVDVNTVLRGLAAQMGLVFETTAGPIMLSNPCFEGSAWTQMRAAADAAGVNATIDDGILAVWPKGGARPGLIPEVSVKTGMIGYPAYTANGLYVRTIFNPYVRATGKKVKIVSDQKPACGEWQVLTLDHDLSCNEPGGQWSSAFECYNPSLVTQR